MAFPPGKKYRELGKSTTWIWYLSLRSLILPSIPAADSSRTSNKDRTTAMPFNVFRIHYNDQGQTGNEWTEDICKGQTLMTRGT